MKRWFSLWRKLGEKTLKLKEQQYEAFRKIVVDINQDTVCVFPTGYENP
jgi:hypothetical protein